MTWTEVKVKPKTPIEDFPDSWSGRRWDGPGSTSIESDEAPAFIPVPDSDGKLARALPPTSERRATVTIKPGQYVVDTKYGTHVVSAEPGEFEGLFEVVEPLSYDRRVQMMMEAWGPVAKATPNDLLGGMVKADDLEFQLMK